MDLISVRFRRLEGALSSGGREVGEVCRAGDVVVVFVCLYMCIYVGEKLQSHTCKYLTKITIIIPVSRPARGRSG
jgi:hypothetical protein